MATSIGSTMCKAVSNIILFIVNFVVLLVGAILMIVGGLMQWSPNLIQSSILPKIFQLSGNSNQPQVTMNQIAQITSSYVSVLSNSGLIIFIIGVILVVISFSGLIGVCCRNRVILIIYILLVTAILILIVIFIIVFLVYKNQLQTVVNDALLTILKDKYIFRNQSSFNASASGLDVSGIIDLIQMQATCCGSVNGSDYQNVPPARNPGTNMIPFSCCVMNTTTLLPQDSNCMSAPNITNSFYYKGCSTTLWDFISLYSSYAAYSLIGLAVILFILIVMAAVIARSFEEK